MCYQRPSVDVLFSSVAEAAGAAAQVFPLPAIAEAMLAARVRRDPSGQRASPDANPGQGRPAVVANVTANQS